MSEGKVFLYFLTITTFDWLQLTAFRIRPNPEALSRLSQFEAWFGLGITVVGVVFLFLRNGGGQGKDFLYQVGMALFYGFFVTLSFRSLWSS
jgi:hypothetical protein